MPELTIRKFNGINYADPKENLVQRSFQFGQQAVVQSFGIETHDLENIDITSTGIRKRKGSTAIADPVSAAVLLGSDVIVAGKAWINPSTGENIKLLVSKKTIYAKEGSASWKQLNDSASAAYTHSSQTVTKASIVFVDGHAFIGTDGTNNYIQAYKSGDDLDAELSNGNTYEEAYSASTHVITGTWTKACYMLAVVHNRLVFSAGNTLLQYTPTGYAASSGIWDFTNGGFYIAAGNIRSLTTFTPKSDNSIYEVLYVGSSNGIEIIPGFSSSDAPYKIEGSKPPLGHRTHAFCLNWLVYLTSDFNIIGINGRNVIDLGRRAKSIDESGILDQIDQSDTESSGFGFYNSEKKQAQFWVDLDGATVTNDTAIVLDFSLGEPQLGEPVESFEKRVSILVWKSTGASNLWFSGAYVNFDKTIDGFLSDGNLFQMESGNSDFGSTAISAYWYFPVFDGVAPNLIKQWLRNWYVTTTQETGDAEIDVNVFLDEKTDSSKDFSVPLTYPVSKIDGGTSSTTSFNDTVDGGDATTASWDATIDGGVAIFVDSNTGLVIIAGGKSPYQTNINLRSRSIEMKLSNATAGETFILNNLSLAYQYGAEVGR